MYLTSHLQRKSGLASGLHTIITPIDWRIRADCSYLTFCVGNLKPSMGFAIIR